MLTKLLTISGTVSTTTGNVVIVFGGHLARDNEWGAGKGAADEQNASIYKIAFSNYSGGGGGANVGVKSTAVTDDQAQADLSISKADVPDPICAGSQLTYTLSVHNAGPTQATSVSVVDTLLANTTFASETHSQ